MYGCTNDRHSDLPPEKQLDRGLEALSIFNFNEAQKFLSLAQPQYEVGSTNWPLATYSLALATWHSTPPNAENVAKAKALLLQVVEQAPSSEFAASALVDLGRIEEASDYLGDVENIPSAREYYQRVRMDFPQSEMSFRATLFLAQTYAQTFDPEQVEIGIELLDQLMASNPPEKWKGLAAQYTAQLYAFYLDQPEKAYDAYRMAVDSGLPRPADIDVSLWQFGLLAEKAGHELEAVEIYSEILREHPRSIYGTLAYQRAIDIAKRHPDENIHVPEQVTSGVGRTAFSHPNEGVVNEEPDQ